MTPKPQSPGAIHATHQNALALRAWEAVSPERDLKGVLAAVSDLLLPVIPFDGIGIVFFSREVERRLFVLHLVGGSRRPGESDQDFIARTTEPTRRAPVPSHPQAAYDGGQQQRMKSGEPYTCRDIQVKPEWYPHEFRLAAAGIRAYVSLPLMVRGRPVGVATLGRRAADEFTPDEIKVLR
ncbi:MAG: GAF domain-containing protein, partial [Terriglobia bacterium]